MEGAVQEQTGRWMVQGMGKRDTECYSERLNVVWEYSKKCHEIAHPPDSKTLPAGSVLLKPPHHNVALVKRGWSCSPSAQRGGHGRS